MTVVARVFAYLSLLAAYLRPSISLIPFSCPSSGERASNPPVHQEADFIDVVNLTGLLAAAHSTPVLQKENALEKKNSFRSRSTKRLTGHSRIWSAERVTFIPAKTPHLRSRVVVNPILAEVSNVRLSTSFKDSTLRKTEMRVLGRKGDAVSQLRCRRAPYLQQQEGHRKGHI